MHENPSADKRRASRFSFIASAQVTDAASGAQFNGRMSDISQGGCYIDMLNPVPAGSDVLLRISHEPDVFEAAGRVVYAAQRLGMGVVFTEISAPNEAILDRWLAQLRS